MSSRQHDESEAGGDEFDPSGRFRSRALEAAGRGAEFGPAADVSGRIRDRVGARERIRALVDRTIPFHPQMGNADCGPAALSMSLSHLGLPVSLPELREQLKTGDTGSSMGDLVRLARRHGADARGVRTTLDGLSQLAPGSILFWKFNHFVVLERAGNKSVVIVDPASGRRTVPMQEIDDAFTGIAIEMTAPAPAEPSRTGDRARRGHPWGQLRMFVPKSPLWVPAFVVSAGLLLLTLTLPFAIQTVIDTPARADGAQSWSLVAGLVAVVVLYAVLQLTRGVFINTLQSILDRDSTRRIVSRLLRLPYGYFAHRHPGDLAQRARAGSRLRHVISSTTAGAAFDTVLVVAFLAVIGSSFGSIAFVAIACVALFAGVVTVSWKRQQALSADALAASIAATSTLHEVLDGMPTVKSLGAEDESFARWGNLFAAEVTATSRKGRHAAVISGILSTVQFTAPLGVLVIGFFAVSDGRLEIGQLVALSALTTLLFGSLMSLSTGVAQLSSIAPDLARVEDIMAGESERTGSVRVPDDANALSVEVTGLSHVYEGAVSRAVTDLDVEIPAGAYVGVLGASGSGKSTLGALIAGLFEAREGTIRIGDVDIADLDVRHLRRRIGYVDQNSRLVAGSIASNLRLGAPEADLDELQAAARLAAIHDDIAALPMGYDTVLTASGGGLSGGQRQRIALARTLVKRPPLLILDEATSAVDPPTERVILQNLRALGCTVIVIAHRLNLVSDAQEVFIMDGGRIVDRGAPAQIRAARGQGDEIIV